MDYAYQFKITLKQQLRLFIRVPLFWLVLISIWVFILGANLLEMPFIITSLIFFTFDTLPTIAVHWQYWNFNHNSVLNINTGTKEIAYNSPGLNVKYSFDDIATLHYYYSYAKASGKLSFSNYRYYKIIFRDNTEIIITCLMVNHIELILEMLLGIKAFQHSQLICLLN